MEEENLSGKEENKVIAIFKKKEIWISVIVGLILGAALIYACAALNILGVTINKTVATFKGGNLKQKDLAEDYEKFGLNYTLQLIDNAILNKAYELTDEQKEEIDKEIDEALSYYGYTEETFSEEFNLNSRDEIAEFMGIISEYKSNLAYIDYLKTIIPTEDIENYYNENVEFGEINTKHILVQPSNTVSEDEALKVANEIIAKLDEGKSFEELEVEYEGKVISEEVDFDNFNAATLATEYVEASKLLEKDTYTKEPVKTSFGYHIIYCINKEDKPSLEDATNSILKALGANLQKEDQYIKYKALIKLREEYNVKFANEIFEEEYKEYCKQVNGIVE